MDLLIRRQNKVWFSRYLIFLCVFDKSKSFKICDIIIRRYTFECFFRILGSIKIKLDF